MQRTPSSGALLELQRYDYFNRIPDKKLRALEGALQTRKFMEGEVLFRQGQTDGGSCFFLKAGVIAVYFKSDAQMHGRQSAQAEQLFNAQQQQEERRGTAERAQEDKQEDTQAHCEPKPREDKPAHCKSKPRERLGGTRAFVGVYMHEKFVPIKTEPDDHGEFLYRQTPGGMVGILSALTGCARGETAVAEVECQVFELRSRDYKELLAAEEDERLAVDCLFLRKTPCFHQLPDTALFKLVSSFQRVSFPHRIEICQQGSEAVAMHVIRDGVCEVVRQVKMPKPDFGKSARSNINLHLADLARNDLIGHHELLSNTQHSFSVSTKTNVELWSLSSESIDALVKEHGQEMKKLKKALLEHGRTTLEFHQRRAYETGAARFDRETVAQVAQFGQLQEAEMPRQKAAKDAEQKVLDEKERRAGNFCNATESGPALVSKILQQKVYTRVVELQPRIYSGLLIPLNLTQRSLPDVLRKRKKTFNAPVKVDLTAGVPATSNWAQEINYEEPFKVAAGRLSKRELLIHNRLNQAVNMFDAYASLAETRLCQEKLQAQDRSKSPQRSHSEIKNLSPRSERKALLPAVKSVPTSQWKASGKGRGWRQKKQQRIDLKGFLSLLEGADLVDPEPDLILTCTHDSPDTLPETSHGENLDQAGKTLLLDFLPSAPDRSLVDPQATSVRERFAIRIFLAAARRLRNASNVPERAISFEHFLACLRAICSELDCPVLSRLKNAKQSDSLESPVKPRAHTSLSVHSTEGRWETPTWMSPLLLRQSKMGQSGRGSSICAAGVRHHRVQLRGILEHSSLPDNAPLGHSPGTAHRQVPSEVKRQDEELLPSDSGVQAQHTRGDQSTRGRLTRASSVASRATRTSSTPSRTSSRRGNVVTPPMVELTLTVKQDSTSFPPNLGFRPAGISRYACVCLCVWCPFLLRFCVYSRENEPLPTYYVCH